MFVWLWFVTASLLIYIAQIAVILTNEHRRQSHLAAWIFVCMVCPYLGFTAYWLVGRRLKKMKKVQAEAAVRTSEAAASNQNQAGSDKKLPPAAAEELETGDSSFQRLEAFVNEHLPYPATKCNRAAVLTDGEETFEAILKAMKTARHHIHLDYYTIRSDGIGTRFLQLLTEKAKSGVEVRVLYDGIGSLNLSEAYVHELRRCGAQTACFSPPTESLLKRRLSFRNHRKIVIVDGRVGFLGGINIGDEYLHMDKRLGYWRDSHLMLEGDSVGQLQSVFMDNWFRATSERLPGRENDPAPYYPGNHCDGSDQVVLIPGKPGLHDQVVAEALFVAMTDARHSIYATTPYFIPDPSIAASLRIAARSGLDVKLIIPGISDSKLVLLATLSYIQDMLDAGVKVYRYGKGFIHAKVMIIDGRMASIGSANLDMRSLYGNYELLALIQGERPVRQLLKDFDKDLADSKAIDPESFAARPAKQKAAESVLHLLSPLL